jgi:hypothetical protein
MVLHHRLRIAGAWSPMCLRWEVVMLLVRTGAVVTLVLLIRAASDLSH